MTNTEFNDLKIRIYCKLGEYGTKALTESKYSIKVCEYPMDNLVLASALFTGICRLELDDSATNKSYCLTEEEICLIVSKIVDLLN
jgi:hypothetical protein